MLVRDRDKIHVEYTHTHTGIQNPDLPHPSQQSLPPVRTHAMPERQSRRKAFGVGRVRDVRVRGMG